MSHDEFILKYALDVADIGITKILTELFKRKLLNIFDWNMVYDIKSEVLVELKKEFEEIREKEKKNVI